MESPFFRNHWNYQPQRPRYVPSMMEIPVHRRTVPVVPKVVSIPVRFVESEKSRSESATTIQKVFRGFLVRKSVKKVVAIEREVNEIQRRLANEETVNLIRNDGKERIRFGEMLMSLLFMLDSVKGVDFGVRNFRKAVIKRAIALQEKVDSIVAVDEATDVFDEIPEAATAKGDSEAVDRSSGMNISGAREVGAEETPDLKDRIPELEDESCTAKMANSEPADYCDDDRTEIESVESADGCNERENVDGVALTPPYIEKEGAIIEESTACSMESNADDDIPKPQVSEPGKNSPGKDEVPAEVDSDMMHRELEAAEEYTEDSRMKGREEHGESRELLEKMMQDNKKMMEMMTQLFEKNEMQSRLLSSLSHRVERLEKALVYEMLRKKKRRNSTDSSEKCPKTKRSGK